MSIQQRWLIAFYALIAIVALIATWGQNLAYFAGGGGPSSFVTFLIETKANPASRSITVDIGFVLLALVAFMLIEARRLGVRFVWLYVLGGFLIAISAAFPLFMIARELRLASAAKADAGWALKASDVIGLVVVTAIIVGLAWFVLN